MKKSNSSISSSATGVTHSHAIWTGGKRKVHSRPELWLRIYRISNPVEISWSRLTYKSDNAALNLVNATGRALPGQIIGVFGPVDSGIDSLAKILQGEIRHFTGEVKRNISEMTFVSDVSDFAFSFPLCYSVRDTLAYYVEVTICRAAISMSDLYRATDDILLEFGLQEVGQKPCAGLSLTQKKLLYVIGMLLNPAAVVVLHNVSRYLSSFQCDRIADRIRLLSETGHSVVVISSDSSSTIFQLSDFVHVIHGCGQCFFADAPAIFQDYLRSNGFEESVAKRCLQDLLYSSVTMEQERFNFLPPLLGSSSDRTAFVRAPFQAFGKASPYASLMPLLKRQLIVYGRHRFLLRAKFWSGLVFALLCCIVFYGNSRDAAPMAVDLLLIYVAGNNLLLATIESKLIDSVIRQENATVCKRHFSPVVIVAIRLGMMIVAELVTILLIVSVMCCSIGVPTRVDFVTFYLTVVLCALFYSFVGSFCALYQRNVFHLLVHLLILLFVSSVLLTFGASKASDKMLNPLFISKSIIVTDSPERYVHSSSHKTFIRQTSLLTEKIGQLSICSSFALLLFVSRYIKILMPKS